MHQNFLRTNEGTRGKSETDDLVGSKSVLLDETLA